MLILLLHVHLHGAVLLADVEQLRGGRTAQVEVALLAVGGGHRAERPEDSRLRAGQVAEQLK